MIAARNFERTDILEAVGNLSDSIINHVFTKRKPLLLANAGEDTIFKEASSVHNLKLNSVMCLPLELRGNFLGLLYLGNSNISNLFTQETLYKTSLFTAQALLILSLIEQKETLALRNEDLERQLGELSKPILIGESSAFHEMMEHLDRFGPTEANILLLGETGTGKEQAARYLHSISARHGKGFVALNCGALPQEIIESELFGHVKGAFTGAVSDYLGKIRSAQGGTLFLDEIGELPLALQPKLLRVIQEREITPVGSSKTIKVDIRLIAATNQNLEGMVKEKRFREDLFYRINTLQIMIPALRQRAADIPLLTRFFLKDLLRKACQRENFRRRHYKRFFILVARKYP